MEPAGAASADAHDEYMAAFLHRTTMLLGASGVGRLRDRTVAIAGCGGVGGATAITLARLGVGGFVLADPGIFDAPDLNRQWAGNRGTLGRNKAEVHAELLRQINPRVRLTTFTEGVNAGNLEAFLGPADLLVDCLDISVPLTLRTEVYRRAMAKGIYAVSAPIFGFGTLILFAEPGGMGMDELIAGFVRVASTVSKLPPGFPDWFFVPHVLAVEREIHKHRVPTSGIAVTVASGLVAAEIARIFLRDEYPGLEGPTVLPEVLAVDPLRRTFRVMHHRELFREGPADRAARAVVLADARHNVVLVPKEAVGADLLSDSGADLPRDLADRPSGEDPGRLVERLYGVPRAVAVFRGRYAEAILAPLVVRPGRVVACNALFPTTRFHVEAAGGRLIDVSAARIAAVPPAGIAAAGVPPLRPSGRPVPGFGGNVDLGRLADLLATGDVDAVWLEPCSNALGGQPISLANLSDVRRLADAARVRLVLDPTRIWENAVLVREREPGQADRALGDIVRELCGLADACAGSLTKDLRTPAGGMISARDEALFDAIRDRTALMTGDGLDADARGVLAGSLRGALERGVDAALRVEAVRALAARLVAVGAPVVTPFGGHAVFVDAAAALPHLAADDHPDLVLANALYLEAGVRVAPNLRTPDQPDQRWVRCAVPVGRRDPAAADLLVRAMAAVLADRGSLRGLTPAEGGPGGVAGQFATPYRERA